MSGSGSKWPASWRRSRWGRRAAPGSPLEQLLPRPALGKDVPRGPRPAASSPELGGHAPSAWPEPPVLLEQGRGGSGFNVARTFPMTDSSARDAALLHLQIMRYPETRISSA